MSALFGPFAELVSILIGALCAYFGAMKAMGERLAVLEERSTNHNERLNSVRGDLDRLTARVDRISEKQ
jgi:hypothetical protein